MLCNNHPAITYISWYGLVITTKELETKINEETGEEVTVEVETPYIITNGRSCQKYIYWEQDNNPFVLKESNEWIKETTTRKMIYINDNGTGTEVPHTDISVYYNDTGSGNGGANKLAGEALGKFDELNNKYMTIVEDVNGIKEVLGSSSGGSGTGDNSSLIERLNILEKTAEGTNEKISTVEKQFIDNKELEELRNNINTSIIDLGIALSNYEESVTEMSKDMEVSSEEKSDITVKQNTLLDAYTVLSQYHQILIQRLENSEEDNSATITTLNNALNYLNTSINNTNSIVNTAISDNTIVPSEITTMLNALANVSLRNNTYKNTVSDAILLGVGGKLTEAVLDIKKTSNEFNQTMSKVVEEIDGETGLKVQVNKNATAIKQNADEISLECVKYDEATSRLTVGDGFIKLDASKVLMTGTLTWDSLDDTAKQNLKGADGTAEYVMLVGEQIIKYDKDLNPNITSITLKTTISNISNPSYTWYYKNPSIEKWQVIDETLSTLIITHNSYMWGGNDSLMIRVECSKNIYDEMTIVKLYDGAKGDTAKYVVLEGEQLFKYSNNFNGTPSPSSITLSAYKFGITSTSGKWYYKTDTGTTWTEITEARGYSTLTVSPTSYFGDSKVITVKYEIETYSDQITIAKISDGAKGDTGEDAYYVFLTNEAHVVSCEEDGSYTSTELAKAKTVIKAFKGTAEVTDFTVSKTDTGCVSSFNNSTKELTITSLTSNTATVSINVTINGNVFNKIMTIAKSIRGKKGQDGTGVQILGELDNVSQLPSTGTPGDAYIIDGLLYVWSANKNGWSDGVPFRGEQGIPGEKGEDGRTTYLHIKYSDDGKTFTSNNGETSGAWLGQYTDFTEADSTVFNDYTWTKIKGQDGDNGIVANLTNDSHTIPTNSDGSYDTTKTDVIFNGCNSKIELSYNGTVLTSGVTYSNTKSSSITGSWNSTTGTYTVTGLSEDTGYVDLKATYNGITYTKRFTVSKNKSGMDGSDGTDGYTINITNDNHSFVANADGKIETQQSTTTTIVAFKGTTSVTPTIGTLPTVNGLTLSRSGATITIIAPVGTSLASYGTFNIPISIDGKSFARTFSYAKVNCGKDGADGYTVILTNENHSFPCENNGNITSEITTTTDVKAFIGTTAVTPTIGTLPTVSGLTLSKSGTTITIKANTGTSLASSGSFNIPITVNGISFTKAFSWSKTFKGNTGDAGNATNLPTWVTEWDNGKTTINGTTVLTPKLFAGTVSNGVPTGVAIGKNVFGTSGTLSNISGVAGYKNGTKTYHLDDSGNLLIGTSSGKHISWDGSTLEVVADKITLGTSSVVSQNELNNAVNNIKIGGTNLVKNSNFANGDTNWNLHTDVSIDDQRYLEEGGSSLKISKSGLTSDAWTGATQTIMSNYTANEEFILSFWYYIENKSTFDGNLCLELKGTNSGGSQSGIGTIYTTPSQLVQGAWTRVSGTIKNSANFTNVYVYPYINRNGTVWITNIQVEKGNKLTDWSSNPYDNADALSNLQKDLMQSIEDSRTFLQIDDNGLAIVSQGTTVKFKSEDEIDAIITEFNNRFETLESGEGFGLIFDQKYAEYGIGGAISTTGQIRNHIDFQSDGSIKLHGTSSEFSLLIEQNKLSFQRNGDAIAWMSTDTLYIKDGEFTNSLTLGNFKWIPRDNGNLSFIHI